jgi:hypothetical protein
MVASDRRDLGRRHGAGLGVNTQAKAFLLTAIAVPIGLFLLAVTFIHFKYIETPYKDVYIQRLGPDLYEVAFKYHAVTYGNMHGPSLPFSKNSEMDSYYWFYLKRDQGSIPADDLVRAEFRRCKNPLYWQKALKGDVLIAGNTIVFSLEIPQYKGTFVQGYLPWLDNGRYNLVQGIPDSILGVHDGYRPPRCDDVSDIRAGLRSVPWNPF